MNFSLKIGLTILVVLFGVACSSLTSSEEAFDWRTDWAVQSGFDLVIDVQGLELPTSMAFVPKPGTSPKDPLYFVTELEGRVKVITNDRSVLTFAEDLYIPTGHGSGMAGICLDPEHGYVFATFSYLDSEGIQRNDIIRFQTTPETFSVSPISQIRFTGVFEAYQDIGNHQIGPCAVGGSFLYVTTGDGERRKNESQRLDSLLGKVLRLTLDGEPAPENPFYRDDDVSKAVNFVWASGFRNPFGLEVVGDEVFVADNGLGIDRFLRVEEGSNSMWDGDDFSIGSNADAVISPGHGVAQLKHYPSDSNIFPARFQDSFYLAHTGAPEIQFAKVPSVLAIPYSVADHRLLSPPRPLVHHRGGSNQILAGLAFGPDGLYFAPMLPNRGGMTAVLKLQYRPAAEYPFYIEGETNPILLMQTHGCLACHNLNNKVRDKVGPVLDRDVLLPRISQRLNSQEYLSSIQALDLIDREPFAAYKDARQAVRSAQGVEKIRIWIENRIQEPRFDDPDAAMPNLDVSAQTARRIADFLTGSEGESTAVKESPGIVRSIANRVRAWLPTPTRKNAYRYVVVIFAVAFLAGGVATAASYGAFLVVRRRLRSR